MSRISCLIAGLAVLGLALPALGQARAAASRPSAAIPEGVQAGINLLIEEIEASIKEPARNPRRTKCDYFNGSTDTLEQDDMLDLLSRKLYRNDNRAIETVVDAYVKWQLLSLQKTPFDQKHAKKAAAVYGKTPLLPNVGVNEDAKRSQVIARLKADDMLVFNSRCQDEVDRHRRISGVLFDYRNELYSRLPRTWDSIRAGFEDAMQRVQNGYDDWMFIERLCADLRAAAAIEPSHLGQMIGMVQSLSGKTGPKAYLRVEVDGPGLRWVTVTPGFDKRKLDQLASDLKQMAAMKF